MAARAVAFVVASIALVTLLGYLGAAVVGIATAPVGVVLAGLAGIMALTWGLALLLRAFRRAGRPLERLVEAAGRVEAGDYTVRVPEDGPADLRSLTRAFNQMSARLEDGDRARRGFLADVSHELRTPLTVIRGQLETIGDGVYPADAAHLAPVLTQTALLERLVEDLRTVSLAESGALVLRREAVDLTALAADVVAGFAGAADAAGVTLGLDEDTVDAADAGRVRPGLEVRPAPVSLPRISADPALLRRVLANLLANAIRHTPRGGSVQVGVETAGGGWQRLWVVDTGPGIPVDVLPRVFDRFVRGPGSDGTGLGLAIARDLVIAHGGTIRAERPAGGGTRVVVELPPGAGIA